MVPDDKILVEKAQAGDRFAFSQLVGRYEKRAYAVAMGVLRNADEAKDVCQEAFLRVHRSLATFQGDSQFFTWMYRIVMNLSIDQLRKRRGQAVEFDEAIAQGDLVDDTGITPKRLGFDPAKALADKELRQKLEGALQQLSPLHRSVLIMREVEGLAYQEMADAMGCSIGTIMSRLFHARKNMQTLLGQVQ